MKIKRGIENLSLYKKFISIFMIGVLLVAIVAEIAIYIVEANYQKMLYNSLNESIEYSANEIEDYMESMEELTRIILSDDNMQESLNTLKHGEPDSLEVMNALRSIRSGVGLYYQSFSDNILQYITLYTDSGNAYTNILEADRIPREIQEDMISRAGKERGKPYWITDYMDEYGLFLGRTVNSIDSYKLEPLGTILLNIDMDRLLDRETEIMQEKEKISFVIFKDDEMLFHTGSLSEKSADEIVDNNISDYKIITLQGHKYFAVYGEIEKYNWDYYCLVSWDTMHENIEGVRVVWNMCIAGVIIVVFIISAFMFKGIMKHIKRLLEKMQKFALNNNELPKIEYDYSARKDEIGILHRQFDQMSQTIVQLIRENYINELLKKETQIKALENQINPHFLYNTLESIRWRAKAIGETDISDMVEALGSLLRLTLKSSVDKQYLLKDEMEIIEAYITIQTYRHEERLKFSNQIDKKYYGIYIPKLSLQPLIENAIYYGVETNVDGAEIILSMKVLEKEAHFYVKNSGSEMPENIIDKLERKEIIPKRHGIGLLNINERLKMEFGDSYGIKAYNEDEFAVVELVIPMEEKEEHDKDDYSRG